MKKLRVVWGVVEVIIMIYVVAVSLLFLNRNSYGYPQIGKNTFINVDKSNIANLKGSHKGDLLVVRDSKEYHKNEEIYYYIVLNEAYSVKNGKLKDNNNFILESGDVVSKDRIIGHKILSIGSIGYFLKFVEKKIGFLLLVFVPILIVFFYQVFEFVYLSREEQEKLSKIHKKVSHENK